MLQKVLKFEAISRLDLRSYPRAEARFLCVPMSGLDGLRKVGVEPESVPQRLKPR